MLRYRMITTGFPGGPGYNIFHTTGTTLDEADARSEPFVDFMDGIASLIQNQTTMVLDPVVNLVDEMTGDVTGSTVTEGYSRLGTFGSQHAVAGTCLLARWRTGVYVGSREIRGRSFLSGLGDFSDANGAPDPARVLTLRTAADTLVAAGDLRVWSPTKGTSALVAGASVYGKYALMRSRRD